MERRMLAEALGIEDRCICRSDASRHRGDCNAIGIDVVQLLARDHYPDAYRERLHRHWHETIPADFVSPYQIRDHTS